MRILLTGASSFTGYWFAQALAGRGHEVTAPLRRATSEYDAASVRGERVRRLAEVARVVPAAPFGSAPFLALCEEGFDALCHHAAEVERYRAPGFDALGALASNTHNLGAVLAALRGSAVVLTGTVFEPDEGVGDEPRGAVSPYGLSKGLTYQVFRFQCAGAGAPLGKFVVPNPFGPFEEERFGAHLTSTWLAGRPASVRTPLYVRDNIHASLLAAAYARFVEEVIETRANAHLNPSGYVESQGAFAERFAREMAPRLGVACDLELMQQQDFSEPLVRTNGRPATELAPDWSESAAWDDYAAFALDRARRGRP